MHGSKQSPAIKYITIKMEKRYDAFVEVVTTHGNRQFAYGFFTGAVVSLCLAFIVIKK